MGALGKNNPLPFQIGGGPSKAKRIHKAMRDCVGVGGSSPDGSIRDAWFFAKARGLAAGLSDMRAANQAWPDIATDHLPVYEELLGRYPAPNESDQSRRNALTVLWTSTNSAITSEIDAALDEIDSDFVVKDVLRERTIITQNGRGFQDELPADPDASGPPFNIGKHTEWPNYSTEFKCYVELAKTGSTTAKILRDIEAAKQVLRDRLPSWVDFVIFMDEGFILDDDQLDVGAFGTLAAGTIVPP